MKISTIFSALNKSHIDFVLVGDTALLCYGSNRVTLDTDIVIRTLDIDHGPRPVPCEDGFIPAARRRLVAARDLPAGHCLRADDLLALRGAQGMPAEKTGDIIGRCLVGPVETGVPVGETDIRKGETQ